MILNNILFISEQTLKNNCSYINLNTDNKLLTDAIKDATLYDIMPLVGSDLLKELQQQISGNTVSTLNQNLLNNYIQPALIKFASARALPRINFQSRNGGVSKLVGDTFQNVDLNELQYIISGIVNEGQSSAKLLIDYLKANENLFPLYVNPTSFKDTIHPNKNHAFSTGMYIPKC